MLSRDEILIPPYPVITVDVYPDGRAHLNVAGRHVDYPPAAVKDTRAAIIAYAVTVAEELRRPVRMAATDHEGTVTVGVHPNGDVSDLSNESMKTKRRRKLGSDAPKTAQPKRTNADAGEDPAMLTQTYTPTFTEALPALGGVEEETRLITNTSARWAVLAFSTGQRFTVTNGALVGRLPAVRAGEDAQELITLDDPSRTVSKTHVRLEWRAGSFWAIDCASGNGTALHRGAADDEALDPWTPCELQHGDVLFLGDVRLRVTLFSSESLKEPR